MEYHVYWKKENYIFHDLQFALAIAKMLTRDDAKEPNAIIKWVKEDGEIESVLFIKWWSRKGIDMWEVSGNIC